MESYFIRTKAEKYKLYSVGLKKRIRNCIILNSKEEKKDGPTALTNILTENLI